MYINQILTPADRIITNVFLYEGLDNNASKTMYLWESAGHKITEAAMSQSQITQLFQQIEQSATAAGNNRTVIGKGKDAASAVNQAWNNLKTQIQSSKPIKNVDTKYNNIIAKIESNLGGPDTALAKVIQKYRAFAKKHPVAQGFVYAALIAAAGITSAGLGGVAAISLLKTADKLLQGEKFSSAAYQGAKTGALAYGASKVGDYVKNNLATEPATNSDTEVSNTTAPTELTTPQHAADIKAANEYAVADAAEKQEIRKVTGLTDQQLKDIHAQQRSIGNQPAESLIRPNKKLSESQIKSLFYILNGVPTRKVINEGPFDLVKSAASKGANKLKTVGRNLTNKITTDKLITAWKAAGSPTQDTAIANMLKDAGVQETEIASAFAALNLVPPSATQAPGSTNPTTPAAGAAAFGAMTNQLSNVTPAPLTTPAGRVYRAKQPNSSQTPPVQSTTTAVAPIGSTLSMTSSKGTVVPFTKTDTGWTAFPGTPKEKVYAADHPNFSKIEKHWATNNPVPVTGTIFDTPDKLLSDFNAIISGGSTIPAEFKNALKDVISAMGISVTESKIQKTKIRSKKFNRV
jgi:hypothetical protein